MYHTLKGRLFLCLTFLMIFFSYATTSSARTIKVPYDYQTIQAAVNAASPGDVIEVSPGEYRESVKFISKGYVGSPIITLRGVNQQTTVINPGGAGRGIRISTSYNFKISNFTIKGGVADNGFGGGIFVDSSTGVDISNNIITNNTGVNGGGVALNNSTVSFLTNLIKDNTATSSTEARGGGVFLYSSHGVISNNQILNNSTNGPAMAPGGGLFLHLSDPTVSNNVFSGNQTTGAQHYGGGLYIYDSSNFTVLNNTFADNRGLDGGGMAVIKSKAAILNNRFYNNTAARYGGGVYGWDMSSNIEGNIFNQNKAGSGGGGILIDGSIGNSAHAFKNNLVIGNSSDDWGGGVDLFVSTYEISINKIEKNTAFRGGGVLINSTSGYYSNPDVNNNLITENIATDWGGGIGIGDVGQSGKIRNNLVSNNQALGSGGGIVVYYTATPEIINNTIFNNPGGGIRVDEAVPDIMNNIIASHKDSYGISAVTTMFTPFYNDVWDSLVGHNYEGVSPGTGSISADPQFINSSGDDFHLQIGSLCINSGNPNISYNDVDGTRNDMGMYGGPYAKPIIFPEKIGVFRNRFWYLDYSGNNGWDGCSDDRCYTFGLATDTPFVGDWNGDGRKKIGVKRGENWYLDYNGNGKWDGCVIDRCYTFGLATDVPVVGDWSWNGVDKIGVFRNGNWYLDYNGNGTWDGCGIIDRCYTFGLPEDKPLSGKW
ncbi:MAG: hypothetical protein A2Y66_06645 [Nitrospirae bacterium RBG_13_41_22]|nr:MAG: hypothetical protein A2Y66_06645 [Nitrospirae bacterium RBG_13_41_22]